MPRASWLVSAGIAAEESAAARGDAASDKQGLGGQWECRGVVDEDVAGAQHRHGESALSPRQVGRCGEEALEDVAGHGGGDGDGAEGDAGAVPSPAARLTGGQGSVVGLR